jgi:5'-nucleotidase
MRLVAAFLGLTLVACQEFSGSDSAARARAPVQVKLIAFNDFHGYMEAPTSKSSVTDTLHPGKGLLVQTGGAAELATLVHSLVAENPNHLVIGAGDMVGASPLVSALFLDEPTIETLDAVGLQLTSVGNHEFDRGVAELLRKQHGGCNRTTTLAPCQAGHTFVGAQFHYLAANVIDRASGRPILPAYEVRRFEGIPIAFIGATLKATDQIVAPDGIKGVEFRDEADSVNAVVADLSAQGIHSFVLLIHQGAEVSGPLNAANCDHFQGGILPVLDRLDPEVALVVSGHTHEPYQCSYRGFLVTSAASYSKAVTDIELTLDPATGRIVSKKASNRVVVGANPGAAAEESGYRPIRPDPAVAALVHRYVEMARPLAERPVGQIQSSLTRLGPGEFECSLGDVIADAQWQATRDSAQAELAMTNPGGIRTDLSYGVDGLVRYGSVFAAQPFGNTLVTETLSGSQIKAVLEAQWSAHPERPVFLQISSSFQYAFDSKRPLGERVLPESLRLNDKPMALEGRYRVTINSFLAAGGDGFTELTRGTESVVGGLDADALESYISSHSPVAPTRGGRIRQVS